MHASTLTLGGDSQGNAVAAGRFPSGLTDRQRKSSGTSPPGSAPNEPNSSRRTSRFRFAPDKPKGLVSETDLDSGSDPPAPAWLAMAGAGVHDRTWQASRHDHGTRSEPDHDGRTRTGGLGGVGRILGAGRGDRGGAGRAGD